MPQQRRFRRLGTATAVPAGVVALVFLGAPSAQAAAPAECKKGTDPASTIDNWKCQWKNFEEGLKPKPSPTPKPPVKKPVAKPAKPPKKAPAKAPKSRPVAKPKAPSAQVPTGTIPAPQPPPSGGVTTMSRTVAQPYTPTPGTGILPAPQVATDPNTLPDATATVPQTRLISQVAAAEPANGEMLWVATAAAAAGAVGALQLMVIGRATRRRTTR
ncbi:hypothetical protein [Actinomadura flavalba]|uniref:hypothetical protein n=1 Tax=Actinomadura flavalba TaxID=1120938 RepID=UPI00039AA4D5|nr:hypothetical protein [Actinomadura flavalba]